MAKQRPTKVDEFRHDLSPELDAELLRIADLPNISVPEIHKWLLEQGFVGSLRCIYTWHEQHRKVGAAAQKFNKLLEDYQGASSEKALQKLLVVFTEQLDVALTNIGSAEEPISGADYLKALPHLGREIRSCVTAMNSLTTIRDRKALEVAGAFRMAAELRLIFEESAFLDALEEAIKSAMLKIEDEE